MAGKSQRSKHLVIVLLWLLLSQELEKTEMEKNVELGTNYFGIFIEKKIWHHIES